MPRRSRYQEGAGKFPSKSAHVALTGTSYVTLVPSPPSGVSYRVTRVFGQNTAGGARILSLSFKDTSNESIVWRSGDGTTGTVDGECFTQLYLGGEPFELGVVLESGESMRMKLDAAGTDRVVAAYDVMES